MIRVVVVVLATFLLASCGDDPPDPGAQLESAIRFARTCGDQPKLTRATINHLLNLQVRSSKAPDSCTFTAADGQALKALPDLVILRLHGKRIGDEFVTAAATHPRLVEVQLHGTAITPKSLEALAAGKMFTTLVLSATPFDAAAGRALREMDNTSGAIYLARTTVSPGAFAPFANSNYIDRIEMDRVKGLNRAVIEEISRIGSLRRLKFTNMSVRGTLAPLAGMDLYELQISTSGHTPFGDADAAGLSGMKWLRELVIPHGVAGDGTLKAISGNKRLGSLTIAAPNATDDGVASLANLPNLSTLILLAPKATDAGLKKLVAAPKLYTVTLHQTRLTDAGLLKFATHPKLRELTLVGARNITADGIRAALSARANPKLKITRR